MSDKRPLENVSYQAIANARKGARARTVNIACPLCGPERKGEAAKRKVMRTWELNNRGVSVHCVRCGIEGWVAFDGGAHRSETPAAALSNDDEEYEKQRRAELAERIWREAVYIEGTPGALHFYKREIDITLLPDFGGLRWHRQCPWQGGPIGCIVARFTDAITGEPRGIWRRPIKRGEKPRTLGPMAGCVIRLWPDEEVTTSLCLAEGVETAAAASQIEHRGALLQPVWAAGSACDMASFPVLPGIEALTLIVDNDASGTGQDAAAACARRWIDAGREVIRLTPKMIGTDFNDIIRTGSAA
jgi:Toprim domain